MSNALRRKSKNKEKPKTAAGQQARQVNKAAAEKSPGQNWETCQRSHWYSVIPSSVQ